MLRRSLLALLCASALCVLGSPAAAQASAPRWFVKEAGAFVQIGGLTGLAEFMSSETLQGLGVLEVISNATPLHLKPISDCETKERQSIEDPPELSLPGTGAMEEFELLCEKETGSLNAAAPYPCTTVGEQFEVRGVGFTWPAKLEPGSSASKSFENFGAVSLEVFCPRTKEHAIYLGSMKPQMLIGKLRFLGAESGEFEEPKSGMHFSLKGTEFLAPVKYQNVRAK